MMMTKMSLSLLLLGLAASYTTAAGSGSCVGRCGEMFTRGQHCTCDFSCQDHNECCSDFQATCITAQSCRGRCGESFRRGRLCECDPQCISYNTCCPDYQLHCHASGSVLQSRNLQPQRAAANGKGKSKKKKKGSNSESEEQYTARGRCQQYPGGHCPDTLSLHNPLTPGYFGSAPLVVPNNAQQYGGVGNRPASFMPMSGTHSGAPDSPAPGSSLPGYSALSPGSGASLSPSGPGTAGRNVNVHLVLTPGAADQSGPHQGFSGPADSRTSTLQDIAQGLGLSGVEGSEGPGTELFADNLCSDSPISGLTALSNGTLLVFKGDLFWLVDPASRSASPPQSITDTLGVPSPIDTAFTRCNCHGNIYIIKGDQFWRLDENMVMEPGYPKPLVTEFPGLTGNINAALAVPATRTRPEIVFFFKDGDIMQRFTFPSGSTPPCSNTPSGSIQRRLARQAEVLLSGEINIKVTLAGFPTPVTSALSMANPRARDQYEHYIFSGPLFFSVHVSGDLPALVKHDPSATVTPLLLLSSSAVATFPPTHASDADPPQPAPANSIRVWLRCP